jgi:hypothetical protein
MAENAHDVTSLDTWSRCRINQSSAGMQLRKPLPFTPQNTFKAMITLKITTDDPYAGVPALP